MKIELLGGWDERFRALPIPALPPVTKIVLPCSFIPIGKTLKPVTVGSWSAFTDARIFDSGRTVVRVGHMRHLRTLVLGFFGSALLLAGCGSSDSCVGGAGPIVSQSVELSPFTGFDFQASGQVVVAQGATQGVIVRGQQNIVDLLNPDVVNGIWDIGFTQCVRQTGGLCVEITLPELTSVELSGAGTVEAETQASAIDTVLSGAGTVTLSGQSMSQTIVLDGSGTVDAFELVSDGAEVVLSGQGNINLTANEQLDIDLSGAGSVFYRGEPQLMVSITGAGDVVDAN